MGWRNTGVVVLGLVAAVASCSGKSVQNRGDGSGGSGGSAASGGASARGGTGAVSSGGSGGASGRGGGVGKGGNAGRGGTAGSGGKSGSDAGGFVGVAGDWGGGGGQAGDGAWVPPPCGRELEGGDDGYRVETLADLRDLAGVTVFRGLLQLESQGSLELLRCLTRVEGTLEILHPQGPDLVGLDALTEVTGDFRIEAQEGEAVPLSLRGLEQLARVGGDFSLRDLQLEEVDPLVSLVQVGGELRFERTGIYQLYGLQGLERLGGLAVVGEPELEALWSASMTELTGGLRIVGTRKLEGLAGLGSLERVAGAIVLEDNDVLFSIDALASLREVGAIYISDGAFAGISNLQAFDGLTSVAGDIFISGEEDPASLEGFHNITSIGGSLRLFGPVRNVDGLRGLTQVGRDVSVVSNAFLQNLRGMSSVVSVGGSLAVERNPALPACEAEWLRDNIGVGNVGGTVSLVGNTGTGTCPP
jgi:hypothetical protein